MRSWSRIASSSGSGSQPTTKFTMPGAIVPRDPGDAPGAEQPQPGRARDRHELVDVADHERALELAYEGHQPPDDRHGPADLGPLAGQRRDVLDDSVEPHEPRDGREQRQKARHEPDGEQRGQCRPLAPDERHRDAQRAALGTHEREGEGAERHRHADEREDDPASPAARASVREGRPQLLLALGMRLLRRDARRQGGGSGASANLRGVQQR